jgi:hypothetical protein
VEDGVGLLVTTAVDPVSVVVPEKAGMVQAVACEDRGRP